MCVFIGLIVDCVYFKYDIETVYAFVLLNLTIFVEYFLLCPFPIATTCICLQQLYRFTRNF